MSAQALGRGWVTLKEGAAYVGVAPDLLRRAIAAGELAAYVKPMTRRSTGERRRYLLSVADIDAWVRSQPRATFGEGVA